MTPPSREDRRVAKRLLVQVGWLAAFVLAPALIALHARDSLPSGLRYGSSAEDVIGKYGLADPGSFVLYGRYLLSQDPWKTSSTGCWPPGMGFINAALFAMFGDHAYLLKTMILSVLLWGAALYSVFRTISRPRNALTRFVIVNSIWVFSSFRYWLLITASIYSESKALPLFVIGVAFLVRGLQTGKSWHYVASGVALALAAYVRAVFDAMIMIAFTVIGVIALGRLATAYLAERLRDSGPLSLRGFRRFVTQPRFEGEHQALKVAGVVLVTALILIVPWKVRNVAALGAFSLRVCEGDSALYWSYDMPSYLISGDAACRANPDLCAILNTRITSVTPELGRRLVLFAIVSSPRAYFANKLRHFPEFWVGTPWSQLGSRNNAFLVEGSISLLAGTVALVWALRNAFRMRGPLTIFSGFFLGFVLQNLLVFSVLHYEYRYSAPIRLFFWFSPWWMASLESGETADTS